MRTSCCHLHRLDSSTSSLANMRLGESEPRISDDIRKHVWVCVLMAERDEPPLSAGRSRQLRSLRLPYSKMSCPPPSNFLSSSWDIASLLRRRLNDIHARSERWRGRAATLRRSTCTQSRESTASTAVRPSPISKFLRARGAQRAYSVKVSIFFL